jgi:hypothetical protein
VLAESPNVAARVRRRSGEWNFVFAVPHASQSLIAGIQAKLDAVVIGRLLGTNFGV